jgi:Pre-toxin TG
VPKKSVPHTDATRRVELRSAAPVRRSEPTDRPPLTAQPGRPVRAQDVVFLQRSAGNRAVSRLLAETGYLVSVQRQPKQRVLPPDTHSWEIEEPYRDQAAMFRTTKTETTAWAEVGPGPPRISYRRVVELQTIDGINFYLDIRGNVALAPGTALPTSPEAALQMRGRVLSQRSVHVEGGDVIEVREYSPHEVGGQSFGFVASAVMPDYAQLSLTPKEQEKAILAYLAKLPRRPKVPVAPAEGRSTVGVAADIGTDFLPIIGELKDLYRAVTGRDPVTGEKLKWWERALAFLGAIPLVGKLTKGLRVGIKWLGRGLSWLKGRGAVLAAWFAEKIEQWRRSRKVKQLAKDEDKLRLAAAAQGKIFLREQQSLVAALDKDGKILAKHDAATISHQGLLDQKLGGKLPDGGRAVTIVKDSGEIHVIDSVGIHGRALPSPRNFLDAVREQVE